MRILQINTERGWRGGERQTLLTALSQRKLGHQVELLAHAQGALAKRAEEQGLVVHRAGSAAGFGAWLAMHGSRYDILHAQTAKVVAWTVLSKPFHRRPIIFSRRTSFPVGKGQWATRWKWLRLDQLVAISEAAAAAPRAMGLNPLVIPSAVPPVMRDPSRVANFLEKYHLAGRRLVGTASALSLEKDPVTLIQAAALVCAQFDDVTFVHWGASGQASVAAHACIEDLGLKGRYILAGFETGVEQLYPALSVFVMASRYEALGSSVLDAMMQHVPVVSTDAGGLKETLADGLGLLGAVGDAETMAVHIIELLDQPEVAGRMAERAYAAVIEEYDVERMAQRYLKAYAAVLAR
jgi:glycosyltransferase involved in cell wall biosynthesis